MSRRWLRWVPQLTGHTEHQTRECIQRTSYSWQLHWRRDPYTLALRYSQYMRNKTLRPVIAARTKLAASKQGCFSWSKKKKTKKKREKQDHLRQISPCPALTLPFNTPRYPRFSLKNMLLVRETYHLIDQTHGFPGRGFLEGARDFFIMSRSPGERGDNAVYSRNEEDTCSSDLVTAGRATKEVLGYSTFEEQVRH